MTLRFQAAGMVAAVCLLAAPQARAQDRQTAFSSALTWLASQQRSDGSFCEDARESLCVRDTAAAVIALERSASPPATYNRAAALSWLLTARPASVDLEARRLRALGNAGYALPSAQAAMLAKANGAGGFGTWGWEREPAIVDTVLAGRACNAAADAACVDAAVSALKSLQAGDGSFAPAGSPSEIGLTAAALGLLSRRAASAAAELAAGFTWLQAQGLGGSYGNELDSALSCAALADLDPSVGATAVYDTCIDARVTSQQPDGSWDVVAPATTGRVITTALIAGALADSFRDVSVSAIVSDPASPYSGDVLQVTVTVQSTHKQALQEVPVKLEAAWGGPFSQVDVTRVVPTLGAEGTADLVFSVPTVGNVGTLSLKATFDANGLFTDMDRANDTLTVDVTVQSARPDLVATAFSADAASVVIGQSLPLSVSVANSGDQDAGAFTVKLFDGDPGAGGVLFATLDRSAGLEAGASADFTSSWTATAPAALHTLYAAVDYDAAVDEGSELNNQLTTAVTALATATGDDLHLGGVSVSPQTVEMGHTVTLSGWVTNRASTATAAFDTSLYLNDGASNPSIQEYSQQVLQAFATLDLVGSWTAPALTGDYILCINTDSGAVIAEDDETNNAACQTVTVIEPVGTPDLHVTALDFDPAWPSEADATQVTVTLRNDGTESAGMTTVVLFWGDSTGSGAFMGRAFTTPIAAGAHLHMTIPISTAGQAGTHTVYAFTDPEGKVDELDEQNNTFTQGWAISGAVPRPDLVVESITVTPAQPQPGELIRLEATIRNAGTVDLTSAWVVFSYEASDTSTVAQSAVIAESSRTPLASHESLTVGAVWSAQTGFYRLSATGNVPVGVTEGNTFNNAESYDLAVGSLPDPEVSPPGLSVSHTELRFGSNVVVTGEINNLGPEIATDLQVELYDGAPAGGGTLIAGQVVSGLEAYGQTLVSFDWQATAGLHDLYVVLDAGAQLVEADESNNQARLSVTIAAEPAIATEPPTGLVATAGDNRVLLAWNASTDPDVVGYRLYRDDARLAALDGVASTHYLDLGAVNQGDFYAYQVSAVTASGEESALSQRAYAIPDSGINSIPVIDLPTDTDSAVVVNEPLVDIGGFSDPGLVFLYRDGVMVGAVVAPSPVIEEEAHDEAHRWSGVEKFVSGSTRYLKLRDTWITYNDDFSTAAELPEWSVEQGSWTRREDELQCDASGSTAIAARTLTATEGVYQLDFRFEDGADRKAALLLGYVDDQNHVKVAVEPNKLSITEVTGGVDDVLAATNTAVPALASQALRLTLIGTHLRAELGAKSTEAELSAPLASADVGILCDDTVATFDRLAFDQFDGTSLLDEDFLAPTWWPEIGTWQVTSGKLQATAGPGGTAEIFTPNSQSSSATLEAKIVMPVGGWAELVVMTDLAGTEYAIRITADDPIMRAYKREAGVETEVGTYSSASNFAAGVEHHISIVALTNMLLAWESPPGVPVIVYTTGTNDQIFVGRSALRSGAGITTFDDVDFIHKQTTQGAFESQWTPAEALPSQVSTSFVSSPGAGSITHFFMGSPGEPLLLEDVAATGATTWDESNRGWLVGPGGRYAATDYAGESTNLVGELTWADYEVETTIHGLRAAGLIARATDTSNLARLKLVPAAPGPCTVSLHEVVAGVETQLAQTTIELPLGASTVARLRVEGTKVSAYVDGALVLTGALSTQTAGRAGLLHLDSGDGQAFSDFSVRALPAWRPVAELDGSERFDFVRFRSELTRPTTGSSSPTLTEFAVNDVSPQAPSRFSFPGISVVEGDNVFTAKSFFAGVFSDASWPVTVTYAPEVPSSAPAAPAGIHAVGVGAEVIVSWLPSTDDAVGYRLYRDSVVLASFVPEATHAFTDDTVSVSTSYAYTVTALSAEGLESVAAGPVNATAVTSTLAEPQFLLPTLSGTPATVHVAAQTVSGWALQGQDVRTWVNGVDAGTATATLDPLLTVEAELSKGCALTATGDGITLASIPGHGNVNVLASTEGGSVTEGGVSSAALDETIDGDRTGMESAWGHPGGGDVELIYEMSQARSLGAAELTHGHGNPSSIIKEVWHTNAYSNLDGFALYFTEDAVVDAQSNWRPVEPLRIDLGAHDLSVERNRVTFTSRDQDSLLVQFDAIYATGLKLVATAFGNARLNEFAAYEAGVGASVESCIARTPPLDLPGITSLDGLTATAGVTAGEVRHRVCDDAGLATASTPDANGFITDWLLVGSVAGTNLLDPVISDEAAEWPNAGDTVSSQTWFAASQLGVPADLDASLSGSDDLAYAATYVYLERPQTLSFEVGSSGAVRLWVDADLVVGTGVSADIQWGTTNANDFLLGSGSVPVPLGAGWHRLLLKFERDDGTWNFSLAVKERTVGPATISAASLPVSVTRPCHDPAQFAGLSPLPQRIWVRSELTRDDQTGVAPSVLDYTLDFSLSGASGIFSRAVTLATGENVLTAATLDGGASVASPGADPVQLLYTTDLQLPSAVQNVGATNTEAGVQLSWSAAVGADAYHVYRDGQRIGTTRGTEFVDVDAAAGSDASYAIVAVDADGNAADAGYAIAVEPAAGQPDLALWPSAVVLGPAPRLHGVPTTIDVTITNEGTEASAPTEVTVHVVTDTSETLLSTLEFTALAPGASATRRADWLPEDGMPQLRLTVDPTDAIAEGDESNNTVVREVRVAGELEWSQQTACEREVWAAIDRGLDWLRADQDTINDRVWSEAHLEGTAALVALAMIYAGHTTADTALSHALGFTLRRAEIKTSISPQTALWPTSKPHYTAGAALSALLASGLPHLGTFTTQVEQRLRDLQKDAGAGVQQGGWDYGGASTADVSNSQFIAWALVEAGVPSSDALWQDLIDFFARTQWLDAYNSQADASNAACAGYESGGHVYQSGYMSTFGTCSPPDSGTTAASLWGYQLAGLDESDPRVAAGIDWMRANFNDAWFSLPAHAKTYIWTATKAFIAADILDEVGGQYVPGNEGCFDDDAGWRFDIARALLDDQHEDGYFGNVVEYNTALAVLSLLRATPWGVEVSPRTRRIVTERGGVAHLDVTLRNLGHAADTYDITVLGLPAGLTVTPSQSPTSSVPGLGRLTVGIDIDTPADLDLWEDGVFELKVQATSTTRPVLSRATSPPVTLIVQPGDRTRIDVSVATDLATYPSSADVTVDTEVKNLWRLPVDVDIDVDIEDLDESFVADVAAESALTVPPAVMPGWDYAIPVTVTTLPASGEMFDVPVTLSVDFTAALTSLSTSGELDTGAIRVVQLDPSGAELVQLPSWFVPDASFDAATAATGSLSFYLAGSVAGDTAHSLGIYFDLTGDGQMHPPAVDALLPFASFTNPLLVLEDASSEQTWVASSPGPAAVAKGRATGTLAFDTLAAQEYRVAANASEAPWDRTVGDGATQLRYVSMWLRPTSSTADIAFAVIDGTGAKCWGMSADASVDYPGGDCTAGIGETHNLPTETWTHVRLDLITDLGITAGSSITHLLFYSNDGDVSFDHVAFEILDQPTVVAGAAYVNPPGTLTRQHVWNTADTEAGDYRVRSTASSGSHVAAATADFTITPHLEVRLHPATDFPKYGAYEPVFIEIYVANTAGDTVTQTGNVTLEDLSLTAVIRDTATSTPLAWSFTRDIDHLDPGHSRIVETAWNTELTAPGDYEVYVELLDDQSATVGTPAAHDFEIVSTTASGDSLYGTFLAHPSQVEIGAAQGFDFQAQNLGNADVLGATLKVLFYDADTEPQVQVGQWSVGSVDILKGQTYADTATPDTSTFPAGDVVALLQLVDTSTYLLDVTDFEAVVPPVQLSADLDPDLAPRVLIARECTSDCGCQPDATTNLDGWFTSAGTVFGYADGWHAWRKELRSGMHNVVLPARGALAPWRFDEELSESAYAGTGLVLLDPRASDFAAYTDAAGLTLASTHTSPGTVDMDTGPLAAASSFTYTGDVRELTLGTATRAGYIDDSGTERPVIATHDFGDGRAATFGLDPESEPSTALGDIVVAAADHVSPQSAATLVPSQIVHLTVPLTNSGTQSGLAAVEISLPAGVTYEAAEGSPVSTNPLRWELTMNPGTTVDLRFSVALPNQTGSWDVIANVERDDSGTWTPIASYPHTLVVSRTAATIASDASTSLAGHTLTGTDATHQADAQTLLAAIDNAAEPLPGVAEARIAMALDIIAHLRAITGADVNAVTADVALLLRYWQSQWRDDGDELWWSGVAETCRETVAPPACQEPDAAATVYEVGPTRTYTTISAAVSALANPPTTPQAIVIDAGTYSESIFVMYGPTLPDKRLQILARCTSGETDEVIIDGGGTLYAGVELMAWYIDVAGLEIKGFTGPGVSATGGDYTFESIRSHDNTGDGIYLSGGGTISVTGSAIWSNGGDGLNLNPASDATLNGVVTTNNGGDGLELGWSTDLDADMVVAAANAAHGAYIHDSSDRADIADSTFCNNTSSGLWLLSAPDFTVSTSRAEQNGAEGFLLDQVSGTNLLTKSRALSNTGAGIKVHMTGGATLQHSRASCNANGLLADQITATLTADNLLLDGNSASGVRTTGGSGTLNLTHSTSRDNDAGVTRQTGDTVIAVTDSIISDNTSHGLLAMTTVAAFTSDYNDVWSNTTDYSGVTAGTNDLSADPQFVGDSYLDPALSTCVDAGSATVPSQLSDRTTDYAGTLDTGTVDLGYHHDTEGN